MSYSQEINALRCVNLCFKVCKTMLYNKGNDAFTDFSKTKKSAKRIRNQLCKSTN